MRFAVFALLAVVTARLQGAVVQGVVLDEESGNPLARTTVSLIPLPGVEANAVTIRANERGAFTILSVRAGWYVLRTSRRGFATAEAGQMRPGRPGLPFEIAEDKQSMFVEMRMRRLGAIAGAVLDENSIGIPEWPVNIYTVRKPIQRIAQVKTDDRGIYRIGELEPGSYIARTGEGLLDDGTPLLPTYYKYGTALDSAEPVRARLGETTSDIAIRPVKGRLLEISGTLNGPGDRAVQLTMVTDTGRRLVATLNPPSTTVAFSISSTPPGLVDLIAQGTDCGGYSRVTVDRDMEGIRIGCAPLRPPYVNWIVDNSYPAQVRFPLLARRVDLDGTGPAKTLGVRETLAPGHWEFLAQTSAQFYTTSIRGGGGSDRVITKNDGWFGLDLGQYPNLQVNLSSRPAAVSGTITTGGKPVSGAAVYLEMYDPEANDARVRLLTGRADGAGSYRFAGLAPGRYRILSSFDFDPEDRTLMQRAANLTLHEGETASQSLEMMLP
ncbi:MAG TPA: carboxypeptidase-like regulatory domain-containing protein [Bryobacteraceae bacterium]|nr:carboxypeptidase-like regulatory domain-containing protein [Bryobacteraceae bacterium]